MTASADQTPEAADVVAVRKRAGWTQTEAAALLDMEVATYARIERDEGQMRPQPWFVMRALAGHAVDPARWPLPPTTGELLGH